jgi:tetratricopeptide (TPR) repeat protein
MSGNLVREAEFLLRVSAESSTEKLRAMLKGGSPEREIPILRRLNELYDGQDLEVLLRLAFRCWTEGQDDEAVSILKQAESIAPEEQRVLRLVLFFAVSFGEIDEAGPMAQHLLDLYPEDQWAATLKHRLETEDRITTINLPSLGTEWD